MPADPERPLPEHVASLEHELSALRLKYDDLRREHERVVGSPGWRVLSRVGAIVARVPVANRLARAIAARLANGSMSARRDGWVPTLGVDSSREKQLAILRASPFFDARWYKEHNADFPDDIDLAAHYLDYGAREGRRPGPLFNTQHYLTHNPDVAGGLNPIVHYQLAGAREGRTGWTSADLLAWQAPSIRDAEGALARVWRRPDEPGFLERERPVALYVSSVGNFFFREMAELIALGLREAGHAVTIRSEGDALPASHETALVLAPHEFYYLGDGIPLAQHPAFVPSIPIGTEQWQTMWFARALPFMLRAERILDINLQSADAFARLGKTCRYLVPGYSSGAVPYSQLPATSARKPILRLKDIDVSALSTEVRPLDQRPIDVLFVGAHSQRRDEIIADLAPVLARHTCVLHLTDFSAPLRAEDHVDAELFTLLARNSRVLLNVHHSEMSYFEWQRLVFYGTWQRSVVVTESCLDVPFFRNSDHYIGVRSDKLGEAIDSVLCAISRGDAAPQQIVDDAWSVLTTRYLLSECLTRI